MAKRSITRSKSRKDSMRISWRSWKRLIPQTAVKRWLYGGLILLGALLASVTAGWGLLLSLAVCVGRVVEVIRKPAPVKTQNFPVWESRGYFFEGDGN